MSYTFAQRAEGLRSSAIRDLLKLTERDDVISLAGGLPAPESFPIDDLRRATADVLDRQGPRAVQYSATDGVAELRAWLAAEHGAAVGRPIDVEGQIVVTHGSQQALDLLAKVLVDTGDVVVTESPAYLGAVQAIELFRPRFEVVPGDERGMRVDVLAERLDAGLRPRFVYVVANFHNPTGATLSLDRRRHLAELADRYELLIVEDDPYGSIRFAGDALPPIAAFTDRVVHLSTFSKIVAPGLRVGWMIGPPEVMARVARAKQAADLHTSTFAQLALLELVSAPGWLEAQRARIVPLYRERCERLAAALVERLGERVSFTAPDGGMFLWTRWADVADTAALLDRAIERGVAFVPGAAFTIDGARDDHARLSFSTVDVGRVGEAVDRVAAALADLDRAPAAT